jgi:hypothetical protein
MPSRWKRTLLYAGYLLLVTLPLLEMGVRAWGYAERHIYDPIYRFFEPSEDIPYIHKPNLIQAQARGLAVINTDSLGLRSKTSGAVYGTKQPHEYRIAIVGDSVTFGEGIPRTEDTFAQVLEETLNRQQQTVAVKVFNFGASAYSVKQMAAMLHHRMVHIQPDLVIMAIIPQDFNLSRTPIIDASGYLIDQRIGILLDSPVREVLREIHLLYVLREIALPWFSSSQDVSSLVSRGEIPESYRYIQRFKETTEQHGLASMLLLLPRMEEKPWGSLPDRLTQDAITSLDLSSLSEEFTREEYMASRFDPHASPAVHRRIGESLAAYVQHQPEFPQ